LRDARGAFQGAPPTCPASSAVPAVKVGGQGFRQKRLMYDTLRMQTLLACPI